MACQISFSSTFYPTNKSIVLTISTNFVWTFIDLCRCVRSLARSFVALCALSSTYFFYLITATSHGDMGKANSTRSFEYDKKKRRNMRHKIKVLTQFFLLLFCFLNKQIEFMYGVGACARSLTLMSMRLSAMIIGISTPNLNAIALACSTKFALISNGFVARISNRK